MIDSASRGDHVARSVAARKKRAGEIHIDDFLPTRQRNVLRQPPPGCAGIVDQDVERAELVRHFGDRLLDLVFTAASHRKADRAALEALANARRDVRAFFDTT